MVEILRKAIEDSGERLCEVSRGTGIAQPILHRFVYGERDNLTIKTADKLLAYFGFELVQRKG